MSTHSLATGSTDGIHAPFQWTFATAAARNASTDPYTGAAYLATDIGKHALQSDTYQEWILTATTPTWQACGIPILTTTQRNALTATPGLTIFNSSTNKLNVWTGGAWEIITSA